ncbi:MAG: hypothetical protein K0U68_04135 [Gammaproteobacteria bacterium]|nr:hypothetical protein [Gammaproteobacteria bacterium]
MSVEIIDFTYGVLSGMYSNAAYEGLTQILGPFAKKMKTLTEQEQRHEFDELLLTLLDSHENLQAQLIELQSQIQANQSGQSIHAETGGIAADTIENSTLTINNTFNDND